MSSCVRNVRTEGRSVTFPISRRRHTHHVDMSPWHKRMKTFHEWPRVRKVRSVQLCPRKSAEESAQPLGSSALSLLGRWRSRTPPRTHRIRCDGESVGCRACLPGGEGWLHTLRALWPRAGGSHVLSLSGDRHSMENRSQLLRPPWRSQWFMPAERSEQNRTPARSVFTVSCWPGPLCRVASQRWWERVSLPCEQPAFSTCEVGTLKAKSWVNTIMCH